MTSLGLDFKVIGANIYFVRLTTYQKHHENVILRIYAIRAWFYDLLDLCCRFRIDPALCV
jgi:hypothetical protein